MDDFANNPFRGIRLGRAANFEDESSQKSLSDEDRALFLRSWQKTPATRIAAAKGFLLKDQVSLPDKVKKKKKARTVPTPLPAPAPLVPEESEDEAFLQAVRTAVPLGGKGRKISVRPVIAPRAELSEVSLEDYLAGKLEFAVSSRDEYIEGHVVGLDEMIVNRLKEGQFSPEAHLDLHGLNSDQAFEALKEFIRQAWYKDLRTILIVPGRGLNSPNGMGILRQRIQLWLTREPFKRIVLAFCTARPHDGGPGSLYVMLRRYRKKGPVQWDRMFIEGEWE